MDSAACEIPPGMFRYWTLDTKMTQFAAASGHVDLCAALIGKGAEKQALAFEGPTEDAL